MFKHELLQEKIWPNATHQLSPEYVNWFKTRQRDLFALQLVQLQLKACLISWDESICLFSWRFYTYVAILISRTPTPPTNKEIVIMRWMSPDTIKLRREQLTQGRSLTSIRWASWWLATLPESWAEGTQWNTLQSLSKLFCFPSETRLRNTWLHYPFLLFITLSFRYGKSGFVEYLGSTSLAMRTERGFG